MVDSTLFDNSDEFYRRTGIMRPEELEAARREWDEYLETIRTKYRAERVDNADT